MCTKLIYWDDLDYFPGRWSWYCTDHPSVGGGVYRTELAAQQDADLHTPAADRDADHAQWRFENTLDEAERTGN